MVSHVPVASDHHCALWITAKLLSGLRRSFGESTRWEGIGAMGMVSSYPDFLLTIQELRPGCEVPRYF